MSAKKKESEIPEEELPEIDEEVEVDLNDDEGFPEDLEPTDEDAPGPEEEK